MAGDDAANTAGEIVILTALRRIVEGGSAPEVGVHWLTESARIATIRTIAGDGSLRRGRQMTPLAERELIGRALPGETKTFAAEMLASGFPRLALPPGRPPVLPTIPPVQCTMTYGEHRLAVHVPASELDAAPGLDRIRRAVTAVEEAVQKRAAAAATAAQVAAPPQAATAKPNGAKSPLFDTFLELANSRVTWPVVFDRLASHRGFWAPADKLPNGGAAPRLVENGPYRTALLFTAEPPLDAWIFEGNRADAYMKDVWGTSRSQHHRGVTTPLTLPDAQGRPFAVVVTSDLALESYLAVRPHLRSTLVLGAWMDGALLLRQVPTLWVAGVVVDPHTPRMAPVPIEACAALAAAST